METLSKVNEQKDNVLAPNATLSLSGNLARGIMEGVVCQDSEVDECMCGCLQAFPYVYVWSIWLNGQVKSNEPVPAGLSSHQLHFRFFIDPCKMCQMWGLTRRCDLVTRTGRFVLSFTTFQQIVPTGLCTFRLQQQYNIPTVLCFHCPCLNKYSWASIFHFFILLLSLVICCWFVDFLSVY